MTEITLLTLKFIGMILTGVLGAFGLLVKFKDDRGRTTKQGKTALFLICREKGTG
jgi:hypothetical protein